MGCGYSTFSAYDDIVWKYCGPPDEPLMAIKMFPKQQNGLLFRLIYDDGERWAFYNDTLEYEFHIRYYFSPDSDIEALRNATLSELENGNKLIEIIVYPKETQDFMTGIAGSYTSTIEAIPVTERFQWEMCKEKYESKQKGKGGLATKKKAPSKPGDKHKSSGKHKSGSSLKSVDSSKSGLSRKSSTSSRKSSASSRKSSASSRKSSSSSRKATDKHKSSSHKSGDKKKSSSHKSGDKKKSSSHKSKPKK